MFGTVMDEDGYNFRDLFVLDLANNHQGDVEHGLKIIRDVAAVVHEQDVRAAIKFQFRQLDSFVHSSHKKDSDNKHIPRFLSTRLSREQYQILLDEVRKQGLIAMCTPFDEESVDVIRDMDFDIIKIASCSARDWPLLECVAQAAKPVTASTGGVEQSQIDDLVSFFTHRGVDFALMHCVSVYPTPDEMCNLNNIETLKNRYPGRVIGWSTHENPEDMAPIQLAYAKGAEMFERHVGMPTDEYSLNAYSSTAQQVSDWITSWKKARTLCGHAERQPSAPVEKDSIDGLRRGVYARARIESGATIGRDDVYFAMPFIEGQLSSGLWKDGIVALDAIEADAPALEAALQVPGNQDVQTLKSAIHEVKALLNGARVALSSDFEVEYSHHFGIRNFNETGAVLINCINREYCKKIIVQLPGQSHPLHFHKRKEETFQVLWGELHSELDGRQKTLYPGDTLLIMPGVWHRFWTKTGCVFEEISTTHYNDDSVYRDPAINGMAREQRKTIVDHWGRFQIYDAPAVVNPQTP